EPVRTAAGDADELRRDLAAAREALAGAERATAEAEAEARRAQAELAEAAPVRRIAVAPRTLELLVTHAERLDEALVAAARPASPDLSGYDDRDELALKLERDERRLEALGRVNPLAKEEYEAEKERLEELSVQREDLEQSLAELEKLRAELTETVERRFAETF